MLLCFADALGNVGTPNLLGFNETLIVFAGEHAEVLQKAGCSRRILEGLSCAGWVEGSQNQE